jgi:hypothetical protein
MTDASGSDPAAGAAAGGPRRLTVNGVEGPVGVDPDDVTFAWELDDPRRGTVQSGYRIVVTRADRTRTPRTIWDSGHVP